MSVFWGFEDPRSWIPICRSVSKQDVFQHAGMDEVIVPGLELTVPDVQAGTQVLLFANINITSDKQYSYLRVYRGNQAIAQGDPAGSRTSVTTSAQASTYSEDHYLMHNSAITYLDTIPQTGDVRYTIRVANSYYAQAVTFINRAADDTNTKYSHRGVSTLTAITLRNNDIATAGPPGPRGHTGPEGPGGPEGAEGPEGPVGPEGPEGPEGAEGVEGPEGAEGPEGPKGDSGLPGQKGDAGPQGPTGSEGPQGSKGETGDIGPAGPRGKKGDEPPVLPVLAKWLPAALAESFRADHVAAWYCADHYPLGDITFSSGNDVEQIANATRYKSTAKKSSLKYVSGSRAVVKWKTVTGHYVGAENKMPWRVQPSEASVSLYHYYIAFNNSLYKAAYPMANQKGVCVFVVYNLQGYADMEDTNFLFGSGEVAAQRSVCFTPAKFARGQKRCIRIFGVDVPENFIEFSDWGALDDPTATGKWNVMAIWWRPSGMKSSMWLNYGKDHLGGKMLEFDASNNASGATMTVGNHTTGDYPLNGWVSNLEAYDTDSMSEDFIRARMKFLSTRYSVLDSPYKD